MDKDKDKDNDEAPPKRPTKKKFLTVPEAAEEIGMSERHMWREIENGNLKAHHFGGATRISREDLDDYIRRSRG